jgi:general stress protein 26
MKIFNASPGFGAPLTEDEVRNFLAAADSKLNIHLGTVDVKGEPNIHPTWYYFDGTNNRFYIETSKKSMKTENLNRNNTVYYCVDDPTPPYKGVRGKGKVKIHEDVNHNIPIAEKIMVKYLGSLEHPMAKSLISNVKKGDSVILEIHPSYYSTWDYRKNKK